MGRFDYISLVFYSHSRIRDALKFAATAEILDEAKK
jgi:hypothetical protein